jgi:myo-inositol-1(or 4)-monophosphatase
MDDRRADADTADYFELFELAKKAARVAATIHRQGMGLTHEVATKSSRTDLVTEIDRESELAIVHTLLEARPDDAILGEEGAARQGRSGVRWVIDPLDGTVNYVYGYPAFAVSICAEIAGKYRVGVVHDSFHDHVYGAILGHGATCNGRSLTVSAASELPEALLSTGFGYDAAMRARQAQIAATILPRARDIRRSGSAAIDLCHLAAGQIDGYYETGLNAWDYAAGGVIATAAGARVAAFFSETGLRPLIVAGNLLLVEKLLDVLGEIGVIKRHEAQVDLWGS